MNDIGYVELPVGVVNRVVNFWKFECSAQDRMGWEADLELKGKNLLRLFLEKV